MFKNLNYDLYVAWEMLTDLLGLLTPHVVYLKEIHTEGENIKTFVFSPKKKIKFEAGQYGMWVLPRFVWGKPEHLFTVASSPTEDTVQVSTRIRDSDFKQKMASLLPGSMLILFGPIGRFTLGKNPPESAVLIAGGIGVTPMRSISKFVHDNSIKTELTLIHSADGYYLYREEFEANIPRCHFVTKETFPETLKEVVGLSSDKTVFYISGPPAFVTFVEKTLKEMGKKNIKKDGFLGY